MTSVYHRLFDGSAVVEEVIDSHGQVLREPGSVAAHCVCEYGRWMRDNSSSDVRPRIPDLQDVLDRKSPWLEHDPRISPITDEQYEMTPSQLMKSLMRDIKAKPIGNTRAIAKDVKAGMEEGAEEQRRLYGKRYDDDDISN